MALNDPLASVLSSIVNYEKIGKKELEVKISSKMIKNVLSIMKDHRYIGDYDSSKDNRGESLKINLLGNVNRCGVIKPRFAVKKDNYEKFEKRFLPARGFGFLIVSTPKGLMIHEDAKEKSIGGRLIAFVY
ncbi:MAG: 30S ribosomal protein S8 [Nanoarchaeota archaeon]|nr:30S ribosomal protein S8 [Nanoarchaeota archaeon]|tara:strand:+ start:3053 stop:3445 length:393 start_codon:yes stop_codon:yes gene_type:complete